MRTFIKNEAVFCIAALCAVISMFPVPPSPAYFTYIDLRVLCLLFCLMSAVAGLQRCGLFIILAQKLLSGEKELRLLSLILILLPFFSSMFITNDVALITFVPFTILILNLIERPQHLIWLVVLQTVAANLGSIITPVGNPQNLFLYAKFQIPAVQFFATMLPLALVSLILLSVGALCIKKESLRIHFDAPETLHCPRLLLLYSILFLFCLLSVFRILPYGILTLILVLCLLFWDRMLLKEVDYCLLLTFVCFFIFAGNMGRIPFINSFLENVMANHALSATVLTSQVISNVPAAVLLSGFTDQWKILLLGSNIGGLGTPIASLASLISLKYYLKSPHAHPAQYLTVFTIVNAFGLIVLLTLTILPTRF